MFQREAAWIADQLAGYDPAGISPLVNVGSSTGAYRTLEQPWIENLIFRPLAGRGVRVVHCDIKDQPGVDLIADILTDPGRKAVADLAPGAIICSHLLEHVEDPQSMIDALISILRPGGLLIVTVPRSYPYHRDPIDTMFRPAPDEIIAMMRDRVTPIRSEELATGSYRDNVRARPLILFRPLFRLPFPFLNFQKWKRSLGKLRWLVNPYKVSCVAVRKSGDCDLNASDVHSLVAD